MKSFILKKKERKKKINVTFHVVAGTLRMSRLLFSPVT